MFLCIIMLLLTHLSNICLASPAYELFFIICVVLRGVPTVLDVQCSCRDRGDRRFVTKKVPQGYLSFRPIEKYNVFVISACERKTGLASQAFERMHNTLSHRSDT